MKDDNIISMRTDIPLSEQPEVQKAFAKMSNEIHKWLNDHLYPDKVYINNRPKPNSDEDVKLVDWDAHYDIYLQKDGSYTLYWYEDDGVTVKVGRSRKVQKHDKMIVDGHYYRWVFVDGF